MLDSSHAPKLSKAAMDFGVHEVGRPKMEALFPSVHLRKCWPYVLTTSGLALGAVAGGTQANLALLTVLQFATSGLFQE